MKKLREIRDHLVGAVPSLKKNPDRLHVYVEKGSIACRYGNLCFQYGYEVKIMVEDYADHADTLIIPLLAWIATNQPSLLLDGDQPDNVIRIEAEIIDHDKTDILLTIDNITERVIVTEAAGIYTATHCAEPPMADLLGPTGWSMEAGGVEVTP
ncbi:MAG: phage tail protein [Rhodocyclaceae bacterium]|nr:phage tail protein [Rhodocyclaceae bacterium]